MKKISFEEKDVLENKLLENTIINTTNLTNINLRISNIAYYVEEDGNIRTWVDLSNKNDTISSAKSKLIGNICINLNFYNNDKMIAHLEETYNISRFLGYDTIEVYEWGSKYEDLINRVNKVKVFISLDNEEE